MCLIVRGPHSARDVLHRPERRRVRDVIKKALAISSLKEIRS